MENRIKYITVLIPLPSDGMAVKYSAVALPGVGYIKEAIGVNHEELKNHDVMFGIFNDIFNGTIHDDRNEAYFVINRR